MSRMSDCPNSSSTPKTAADRVALAVSDLEVLSVVRYPDPRLRDESLPILAADDSVRALVARMFEMMFAAQGVGLAAPQVGVNVQLFVASPTFDPSDLLVMINPKIVAELGWDEQEEGCLSFPSIYGNVKRRQRIIVEFMDLSGIPATLDLDGFPARVVQHEMDHLSGTLLVDRLGALAKLTNRKTLKDLEAAFADKS
jgi:peptide deformylase